MGALTDEDLYYIEDGLDLLKRDEKKVLLQGQKDKIKDLMIRLYKDFWKTPRQS